MRRMAVVFFGCLLTLLGSNIVSKPSVTLAQGLDTDYPCALADYRDVTSSEGLNGKLRVLKLSCDFDRSNSLDGTITIIERNPGVTNQSAWQNEVTADNQVWIFDYHNDSKAELTINFYHRDNDIVADLYDSPLDLQSANLQTPSSLIVGQSPSVSVVGLGGWWSKKGIANLNLDISIDGPIIALFATADDLAKAGIQHDGVMDYTIHVRDLNNNGLPDYDWRTALFPSTKTLADVAPTALMVNTKDNEVALTPFFPWPYLGPVTYRYATSSPGQTGLPPIQMNWDTGKIEYVGEFVSSRGNANQWFMYSYYPLVSGKLNVPNFESPFAWYDLADVPDRKPDLAIRLQYYASNDIYFKQGTYPNPLTIVRYSWDQNHDGFWDYKLGLVATHQIDTTYTLPGTDVNVKLLPYDTIPQWITQNAWSIATFVSADNAQLTGEGLYEWDVPPSVLTSYFTGQADNPLPLDSQGQLDLSQLRYYPHPDDDHMNIDTGLRGEYQFELGKQVQLYISGVDRKLHLFDAAGSTWNVDGKAEVNGEDQNSDGYLDTWHYIDNGQELNQLINTDGYLIYTAKNEVLLKQAKVSPSLLMTLPPTNHADYEKLGQELQQVSSPISGDDFLGLVNQAEGSAWDIHNATLSDFRFSGGDFRFVLTLAPDYQLSAPLPGVSNQLPAGTYIVQFVNGALKIALATPAQLSFTDNAIALGSKNVSALEPVTANVTLANDGLEDAYNATVTFSAELQGQKNVILVTHANILAGRTTSISAIWNPPQSGNWILHVTAQESNNPSALPLAQVSTQINVQDAQANVKDYISLDGNQPDNGIFLVGLLGALVVVGIAAFLLIGMSAQDKE